MNTWLAFVRMVLTVFWSIHINLGKSNSATLCQGQVYMELKCRNFWQMLQVLAENDETPLKVFAHIYFIGMVMNFDFTILHIVMVHKT